MHTISDKRILMLRPTELLPTLCRHRKADDSGIKAMAKSVAINGIIEPLAVRKKEDGRYELIAGERRLKAAVFAGLRRVPCVLHKTEAKTAAIFSATENLQRKELNFFEKARILKSLQETHLMTETEIALKLGITQRQIRTSLKFMEFSNEEEELILTYNFTEKQALAVLRLPYNKRKEAIVSIISERLGERETLEYIQNLLYPVLSAEEKPAEELKEEKTLEGNKEKTPVRRFAIGDIRLFSNSLEKLTETLKSAGVRASLHRLERERYVEYRIRITKSDTESISAEQLKIC